MNHNIIEQEDYKGYRITLEVDDTGIMENPQEECPLGTLVFFHRDYNPGDKDHGYRTEDFNGWDEMESRIRKDNPGCLCLSVYMYDHSGTALSFSPFSCPWDSGQVGFWYVTRQEMLSDWNPGGKRVTKSIREKVEKALEGQLKAVDAWMNGDFLGYVVRELDEDGEPLEDTEDSCWGYYGLDSEYALEEARRTVDYLTRNVEAA